MAVSPRQRRSSLESAGVRVGYGWYCTYTEWASIWFQLRY